MRRHCQFLFLLFLCPVFLLSNELPDFYMVSIAKSGTNLLQKCVEQMTDKERLYCPTAKINSNYKLEKKFLGTHFLHTHALREIERNYASNKVLVNVRDPRDIFVSAAHFYSCLTYYFPNNNENLKQGHSFDDLSIKERIRIYLIEGMRGRKIPTPIYDVKAGCEYIKNHTDYLLIKFEDLVGEKGGSSEVSQKQCIQSLSNYLSLDLDTCEIEKIQKAIFGDTPTFRKGKVGAWKDYFDDEMKAMFKVLLGEELIFLGYENDMDW